MGELAGSVTDYARRSSPTESRRLVRAVFDAVDEIGRVASAEGIDCDYAKGGTIRVARTGPQAERQVAEIAEARSFGLTEDEIVYSMLTKHASSSTPPMCAAESCSALLR